MLLLLLTLVATVGPAPKMERAPAPVRGPVVVELFTSEGCSSCPAADAALRELVQAQPIPGIEVIALGEHVDAGDGLDWKDGFSSPVYTARRQPYATGFGSGCYTPQAVVNGRYELVGCRFAALAATIASAAKALHAAVSVEAAGAVARVRVRSVPAGTPTSEVLLVLTESGLASLVGRGENAGRLLRHAAVVRPLRLMIRLWPVRPSRWLPAGSAPICRQWRWCRKWPRTAWWARWRRPCTNGRSEHLPTQVATRKLRLVE